jgi:hypothetical protein
LAGEYSPSSLATWHHHYSRVGILGVKKAGDMETLRQTKVERRNENNGGKAELRKTTDLRSQKKSIVSKK